MNIDQRINFRMKQSVRNYYLTWLSYDMRANDLLPSNLKHGGYRNTCYDFRK